MITISLHVPSIIIGFFLGYVLVAALFLWFEMQDRGDFAAGWDAGYEYGCSKKEKQEEI